LKVIREFGILGIYRLIGREMRNETTPAAERPSPDGASVPAVEVSALARRFGGRWALRGVSLRVEPGEVVALLGHNGSGKTTLLRLIATSLRPTRGEGRVFGHDLVQESAEVREMVGVLGHSPALYGDLTAAENLRFAQRMYALPNDPAQIRSALATVGLEREADSRVRGFSAGMQRRLALARLVLRPPRLALFDEPYASFDTDGIALVNRYLAELKASGGAALVATHDLPRARPVADRVIALEAGRIIEASAPEAAALHHGGRGEGWG
jgi:heme exporter protein A